MCKMGTNKDNPINSLKSAISSHSRDWSLEKRDAWIYGIVNGWGDALSEVAQLHNWSDLEQTRLKHLHEDFKVLASK